MMFIKITPSVCADGSEEVLSLIGPNDSLLVADPEGRIIMSKNENKKLVPASILKLLTSLAAFHYLRPDYRDRLKTGANQAAFCNSESV